MKRALQITEPNKDERKIYVKKLRINSIKPGTIHETDYKVFGSSTIGLPTVCYWCCSCI
jgi:hypothetical protein